MPKKASTFDKDKFSQEYNKRESQFKLLKSEVVFTLENKLESVGIKYHSIPSRIKTLDSCLGKIDKHQFENPFEQMRDFVGLRIICLFLSDISEIEKLIKKSFVVIDSDDKVDGGDTSSFGYMSVHYIVRFGSKYKGERYDNIKNIPFEIQVRTIAMDSWANISHYLDYKTEQDIPSELKRDFHALSGMFYVADKHFQLFFEQRLRKRVEIAEALENTSSDFDLPINLDTIVAYLKNCFPGRNHAASSNISELVEELNEAKYATLKELDKIVNNTEKGLLLYEKKIGGIFNDVGAMRIIFSIADDNYLQIFVNHHGYDEKTSTELLESERKGYVPYRRLLKKKPPKTKKS